MQYLAISHGLTIEDEGDDIFVISLPFNSGVRLDSDHHHPSPLCLPRLPIVSLSRCLERFWNPRNADQVHNSALYDICLTGC